MERIEFTRPNAELSCIICNLFAALEAPCGISCGRGERDNAITLFGRTYTGEHAVLSVRAERCTYTGPPEALEAAMSGRCPEKRRCKYGG